MSIPIVFSLSVGEVVPYLSEGYSQIARDASQRRRAMRAQTLSIGEREAGTLADSTYAAHSDNREFGT
jgi:hypothetical protein